MTRYRCTRCKYVYDPGSGDPQSGIPGGTPFSALPESWHCPVSGAPKAEFVALRETASAATATANATAGAERTASSEKPARSAAIASAQQSSAAIAAAGPPPRIEVAGVWTVGSLKPKRTS